MKVAINTCHGSFNLSHRAQMRYAQLKGIKIYPFKIVHNEFSPQTNRTTYAPMTDAEADRTWMVHYSTNANHDTKGTDSDLYYISFYHENVELRCDPLLIQTIEELGDAANGPYSKIKIIAVPAGTMFKIDEYDGAETIEYKESDGWMLAR